MAPDLQSPQRRYQKLKRDEGLKLLFCKSIMLHVTVKDCCCCCCCCDIDECRWLIKPFSFASVLAASSAPLWLCGSRRDPQGAFLCALVCNCTLSTDHRHNHQSNPSFRAHPFSNQHPYKSYCAHISLPHEYHQHFLAYEGAVDSNRRLLSGKGTSCRGLPCARSQLHRLSVWPRCKNPLCC